MNLKERGITIGDLLIIFIIILTTTVLVKACNKDKKSIINQNYETLISFSENSLSKINLNSLSI